MRCSSCEPILDRYVEGTLPALQMDALSRHIKSCASCERLLTELRVVDALLETTPQVELAPNFTFAVMAEARTLPMQQRKRFAPWPILAFYLIAAWVVASAAYVFGAPVWARTTLAPVLAGFANAIAAVSGIAHGLSPAAPAAISLGIAILVLDAVIATGVFVLYRTLQPRVAARLHRSEAS